MIPAHLLYTREHEWVLIEGGTATAGLTDVGQRQMGDMVFVQLPAVGDKVSVNDECGSVESVKAVFEVYAPVDGEIIEVNETLDTEPENINTDPYSEGWLFKIRMTGTTPQDLLDAAAYGKFIAASADD